MDPTIWMKPRRSKGTSEGDTSRGTLLRHVDHVDISPRNVRRPKRNTMRLDSMTAEKVARELFRDVGMGSGIDPITGKIAEAEIIKRGYPQLSRIFRGHDTLPPDEMTGEEAFKYEATKRR